MRTQFCQNSPALNAETNLFLRSPLVLESATQKSSISDHNVVKIPLAYSFGHEVQTTQLQAQSNEKSFRCLDFTKADYNLLSAALNKVDWDELKSGDFASNFASKFHHTVLDICYDLVPLKSQGNKLSKPKNRNSNSLRKKRRLLAKLFALKQHAWE